MGHFDMRAGQVGEDQEKRSFTKAVRSLEEIGHTAGQSDFELTHPSSWRSWTEKRRRSRSLSSGRWLRWKTEEEEDTLISQIAMASSSSSHSTLRELQIRSNGSRISRPDRRADTYVGPVKSVMGAKSTPEFAIGSAASGSGRGLHLPALSLDRNKMPPDAPRHNLGRPGLLCKKWRTVERSERPTD